MFEIKKLFLASKIRIFLHAERFSYEYMMLLFISRRIDWFDRMLGYRPGFRRYFYGLAKYVQAHRYSGR